MQNKYLLSSFFLFFVALLLTEAVSALTPLPINCSSNQDCPINMGGAPYCSGNQACFNSYGAVCVNPGLTTSYCSGNTSSVCTNCPNGCSNGACIQLNTSCPSPSCEGAYDTGARDNNNCPIFACPNSTTTCSTPVCEFGTAINSGQTDKDGCPIMTCYTGYNLAVDKEEYQENDTIFLTISGGKGYVDVFIASPEVGSTIVIMKKVLVDGQTTIGIDLSSYRGVFDRSGSYMIGTSAYGEQIIGGVNTNSILVKVNVPDKIINAYLNQKFELKMGQIAIVQDYKNLNIKYFSNIVCVSGCAKGMPCPPCPIKINIQASIPYGNVSTGTDLSLAVGEKAKVFDVVLSFMGFNNGVAILLVSDQSCPQGCICTDKTMSCPTCKEGDTWNPKTQQCEPSIIIICPAGSTTCEKNETKTDRYRNAYWQCQNGKEWKSQGEECLPAELWKKKAINFCNGKCKGEKCGVISFSLGNVCYSQNQSNQECKIDSDCPQIACLVAPCPQYVCEDGKCMIPPTAVNGSTNESIPLICKDSCPSGDKCYPFGYRKSGKFCSDSGSFELQSAGGNNVSCENNFECKSNVCIDSKCISQSTLQKVLAWFGKLFG